MTDREKSKTINVWEVIGRAMGLIKKRDNWIQNYNAFSVDDLPTSPLSEKACKWCAMGAIIKAASDLADECGKDIEVRHVSEIIAWMDDRVKTLERWDGMDFLSLPELNDDNETSHEDIMEFMNLCMKRARHERMKAVLT